MDERKRALIIIYGLAVFFVVSIDVYFLLYYDRPRQDIEYAKVDRVIDGDTFETSTGEKVRLICIDAPEIDTPEGKESKIFLENLILDKGVILEKDISEMDRYGRLLRYVYKGELFINKELVRNGKASLFPYGNDTKRCDEIAG